MLSMGASLSNMGLPPILQQPDLNSTAGGNSSSPFPSGMVDNLLMTAGRSSPLMHVVLFLYRQLGVQLGLDPSVLLTIGGVIWGASKLASQLWALVGSLLDRHFMSAMYVSEGDHIFTHVMKWLSQHPAVSRSQYLTAQTVWKSAWDDEGEDSFASLQWTDGGEGDGKARYLNFSNQEARLAPRYVPAPGTTTFWHKGTYFKVTRRKESLVTGGWSGMRDVEELRIACFGRSIAPIKRLLSEAKTLYYHDTAQKTTIYRPKAKESRRDWNMWQTVARRPVRPMATVVLDTKEKHNVLVDVNEYLHPTTPRWYASRGIPLRRGYLFHGPPGTGKTSFSFALAGVFGLEIYVISLQDINVTEEDLAVLFTKLPRRCIVLLEDIDTAGLRRDSDEGEDEKEDEEKKKTETGKGEKDEKTVNGEKLTNGDVKEDSGKKSKKKKKKESDSESEDSSDSSESDRKSRRKKRSIKRRRGQDRRDRRGGNGTSKTGLTPESISLSGLLNAIDGVASHEGRVLIMTTNKPESLDEALIRPGRVDLQVAFHNATSAQAGELFHRMYEGSRPRLSPGEAKSDNDSWDESDDSAVALPEKGSGRTKPAAQKKTTTVGPEWKKELAGLSREFARLVPGGVFSPAEIQGFLLKRKKSPRRALEEAPEWMEATMRQKEAKSKVVTVQ